MANEENQPGVNPAAEEDSSPAAKEGSIEMPQGLSPQEQKWWGNLPSSMKRVVQEHGVNLFHFTLNRAALEQELNELIRRTHSQDAQMRAQRMAVQINVIISVCFKLGGWTGEQHLACKRDIDLAINLGAAREQPKIELPPGVRRH